MKLHVTDHNLPRLHLAGTLLVVIVLAIALGTSFLLIGLSEHQRITERLESGFTKKKQERLSNEMAAAIGYLDFLQSRTESALRNATREKVEMAFQTAQVIYDREHGRLPEAEVKQLIREALRPQRFFNGSGYFFIDDLKGHCVLLPTAPEREGSSLWDNQDDTGHYIMRGLVAAATAGGGEGFSTYRWYSPGNPQQMSEKLAFVKVFKPYGWLIGTGDYLQNWHGERLREGIERLRAWKFGETGRFIAIGLDGHLLLQPQWPENEGKHYLSVGTEAQKKVRQQLLDLGKQGGGFIDYPWQTAASPGLSKRTAYVQPYLPWNIVVIATVYEQEMQPAIAAEREAALSSLSSRLPYVALAAGLAIGLAMLASYFFSRWISGQLRTYTHNIDEHARALERQAGELRLASRVFESSREGIIITDPETRILAVNPSFVKITGFSAADVIGKRPKLLASGRHDPDFYRNMWKKIQETGSWSGEIWNRRIDGSVYPEHLDICAVRGENGEVLHYVGTFLDLTERKAAEDRIRQLAEFDILTRLPNRSLFSDRLAQAMALAERESKRVAVFVIDLDRFKTVNDSLGHAIGDEILQEVSLRLRRLVRHSDTVSRLGGDEFAVLLTGLDQPAQTLPVARKILESLSEPYLIREHDLQITPSIGIALYPDNGSDTGTLLQNADAAMYHAKHLGRSNFQFFTPDFNQLATDRLNTENGLRHALTRRELVLHYQPQVELSSGRIVGCEALLRWQPTGGELIPPDRFIPVAEDTGLIVPIGAWVLDEACKQLAAWDADGAAPIRIAVNVAVPQLRQEDFVAHVRDTLLRHRLSADRLEIEVTESVLLDQNERIGTTLEGLLALGVKLSLDDFGTGYASLSYLRNFHFDVLKIDRSFVSELHRNRDDITLIRAIISIARDMSLLTIAEGIETAEQRAILDELGCSLGQGYHFSRPVSAAAMGDLIQRQSSGQGG
ncbi:EAL domain-containing protein [Zoogloea sp.]|uniref:bifunctional diguanylate cyclase/phosphodiesterase n=1 Tax=Zoogloea sp. TaxID=49181 RepID=UPI00261D0379|nr:EAL domain-containing protein [Zoogloea sp.]